MTDSTQLPVIGITTFGENEYGNYSSHHAYVEAVRRSGGLPVLLPPGEPDPAAILNVVDGIIFTGGGDIDPATYNGGLHPTIARVDPQRDVFELTLARLILNSDIPVLGICRGLEVLVVTSGGTLVSHIPDEFGEVVAHTRDRIHTVEHRVQITPESCLATIIGATEAKIVSWHHQAARTVPPGWRVTAYAADGVIEALEHEHHPWAIAVQWHPELSLNDPLQQRLFQALVEAARVRKLATPNLLQRLRN
jgi:putative glutamine amidotransferase